MPTNTSLNCHVFAGLMIVMWATAGLPTPASAQTAGANAATQGRGGLQGLQNVSQQQAIALVQMDADLQPLAQNVTAARSALATAAFGEPPNDQAIQAQVNSLKAAELALANARAAAFAKLQNSPNRLAPDQVRAYAAMGGTGGGGGRGGRGGIPNISQQQTASLAQMTTGLQQRTQGVTAARSALTTASFSERNAAAAIRAAADALGTAELALARARASAFAKLQASPDKLAPAQVTAFTAMGGTFAAGGGRGGGGGGLTGPTPLVPLNFSDHEGYISLFDGVSLKGWDGNPKFWRVENGEIVGESTPQNLSGNSYIVYRGIQAHDLTLKLEVKVDNAGGTGFQYRSTTGLPWLATIPLNVIANVGPVNLNWMMTGPQGDFWPSTDPNSRYTGQFYSENDPMRIMSPRGNVVEGAGLGPKRLMGAIGDPAALYNAVKPTGWNEYTIIARGGTFIHIINGQLMSVMLDDDPKSVNNQSGFIGLEIESNVLVHIRNIWLKKLN